MNKRYYHIIFLFFLPIWSFGQNYLFNTRQLTVEDGILGRRVNSIIQDNEGFIWIATNEGLNRFDGYTFEHFTKSNYGLNANNISHLSKDDNGDIWITYQYDKFFSATTQILRPNTRTLQSLEEKLGTQYQEAYKRLRLYNVVQNNCIFLNNGSPERPKTYCYKNGKIHEFSFLKTVYNEKTDEFWRVNKTQNKLIKINFKRVHSLGKQKIKLENHIPMKKFSIA